VETFKIPKVLDGDATQEDAFKPIKKRLAYIINEGLNCSIIAHGSTGSGKTYTISGGEHKKNGVFQQTIAYVEEIAF